MIKWPFWIIAISFTRKTFFFLNVFPITTYLSIFGFSVKIVIEVWVDSTNSIVSVFLPSLVVVYGFPVFEEFLSFPVMLKRFSVLLIAERRMGEFVWNVYDGKYDVYDDKMWHGSSCLDMKNWTWSHSTFYNKWKFKLFMFIAIVFNSISIKQ